MTYPFIALLGGVCLYALYSEIVTITITWAKHAPLSTASVAPQPLTLVYPVGTTLKSETKSFVGTITPAAIIEEWYNELSIQGLLESPQPPITVIHVGDRYCTLIWQKNPLASTRSLCEHALIYRSLQQTLSRAGYTYQGIYWCDESGPLEDPNIAHEQGLRGEYEQGLQTAQKISGPLTVVIHPYGTSNEQLQIGEEYPLTIARALSKAVRDTLLEAGRTAIIVENQESLNHTERSIVIALGAIKKSPAPYTLCWYESASDMIRYSTKNLRVWVPAYEAAAVSHGASSAFGKKLFDGLAQRRSMSFCAGGMPIAPLYGITQPAVALECCITQKSDMSLFSEEIAAEIIRILQIEDQKN